MSIYTKTGDEGKTSLLGGKRVSKSDLRLNAYGTIDELNSFLGLLRAKLENAEYQQLIEKIQKSLFVVGAMLATPSDKKSDFVIDSNLTAELEQKIDCFQDSLPKINTFIMYGDNEISALCHICRAVARRAEREIILLNEKEPTDKNLMIFMNRLSDFLFIFARKLAM
jgi:cob(I)alamin adenosyltransferase